MIYKKVIKDITQRGIYKPQIADKVVVEDEVQKQLNELPTTDNIIFHKNTIVNFDTKLNFDTNIKAKYSLQENVDYEVVESGFYFVSGENGGVGGSNDFSLSYTLKQSDLPNLKQIMISDGNGYGGEHSFWEVRGSEPFFKYVGKGYESWRKWRGFENVDGKPWTYEFRLNGGVEQTPINLSGTITPKFKEVYAVKFLKDITQKAVIKVVSGGSNYTSTTPVQIIDNNISLEQSFVNKVNESINEIKANELISNAIGDIDLSQVETNKEDITNLKAKDTQLEQSITTNTSDIATIKTQQTNQDNAIASNTQKINDYKTSNDLEISKLKEKDTTIESRVANNELVNTTQTQELESLKTQVADLIEKEKDDTNLVGEIISSKTYNFGDFGFVGDKWYVALKDSVSGDVSNTTNWKEVGFQQKVNLSNYYNKQEVDSLLAQKVDNTTYTQDKQTLGERLSAIELKNTQQDNAIETKLDKSVYEEDKQNFALREQLNEYVPFTKLDTMFKNSVDDARPVLQNDLDINNKYIFNVKTPASDKDASNKKYVDDKTQEAKSYTDTKISEIPQPDLSNYATNDSVDNKDAQILQEANDYANNNFAPKIIFNHGEGVKEFIGISNEGYKCYRVKRYYGNASLSKDIVIIPNGVREILHTTSWRKRNDRVRQIGTEIYKLQLNWANDTFKIWVSELEGFTNEVFVCIDYVSDERDS